MSETFEIDGRKIGIGHPVYVIAEVSANHNGSLEKALRIVEAAAEAGADAVKLQTYTADTLTLECDSPLFRVGGGTIWEGRTLHDLYAEASMPWSWQPRLQAEARRLGLHCFSSPFDDTAVDFLESLEMPAYKIASFELVDHGLVAKVARTGKPAILSTGMATREEIGEAVAAFRAAGGQQLALLKCNSGYPAPAAEMHLKTIPDMARTFGVPVGLSDHTLGITAAVAGVALGACIVEKHLTLSRAEPGPDSEFSLEPAEFAALVAAVRETEAALGDVRYGPGERERASLAFRRSLFAVKDIAPGEELTRENIRSIRPAAGLAPKHLEGVLGRTAARAVARGTPLSWADVAGA
ncbi:pseudaminic acid synthase [soil metagenome]